MTTGRGSTMQSGFSLAVAAASLVWFGVVVAAVTVGPLAGTIGVLAALAGAVALAICHERQAGGRWIGGIALALVPGLVLFVSPVAADEDGLTVGLVLVAVGSVLVLGSMTAASWVRRRFGDAPDTGGDGAFYG